MANTPGKLLKFEVDGTLKGNMQTAKEAEAKVRAFFEKTNNAFQGKMATIEILMHTSPEDHNRHITVKVQGIKKVGQMDQLVSTYWYCGGDQTYWKDAVHVREDEKSNYPGTYIEVSEELFNTREQNFKNAGVDTFWLVGDKDTDPAFFWAKNTGVPQGLVDAFAGKNYRSVSKAEFTKRPPVYAVPVLGN